MTSIRSPQQLGDALRAARKQLGLTQPQLALAAGVGVRFIFNICSGINAEPPDTIVNSHKNILVLV